MNGKKIDKGQVENPGGREPSEVVDVTELVAGSPVLARLVEEVRNEQETEHYAYNRMHNRHNRSR